MPDQLDEPPSTASNSTKTYLISALASLFAAVLAFMHIFINEVQIDAIGFALLFAIWLPWLLPLVQSFEFGGTKVTLKQVEQLKETVESLVDAESEPELTLKSLTVKDSTNIPVLQALDTTKFKFRTLGGIATEAKLDRSETSRLLHALLGAKQVRRVHSSEGTELWGLTPVGRANLPPVV